MNRRELITGAVAGAVAIPGAAHNVASSAYYTTVNPQRSLEDRKREYAICKERGHQGDIDPSSNLVLTTYPASYGPTRYVCKFCGTMFWTEVVSTQHESGAPE